MRGVFQKSLENDSADGPSTPPSPLTPTASPSLIPKPSGEVGRVGRGGYTLRDILEQQHGWEDGLYQKIRIFLRKGYSSLADEYLDTSLAYSTQATRSMNKLTLVCEMASKEFPALLEYEGNWVVHDYLLYFLEKQRTKSQERSTAEG
ncbi:hypothetical protein EDB89DRAFT_1849534 [Lactarius sanguifluus]|nr:hypothetical protein EDB89DRAFT_1849534 [Lactarius sanguifluus]